MTRIWTPLEITLLRELYPDVPAADVAALLGRPVGPTYQAAARYGLKKSAAFHASDMSTRIKRGRSQANMIAKQFKPGHATWNKGLKGWRPPGVEKTQFQKGNRPHTWVPVGSYRITTGDQVLQRKVSDAPGPSCRRWTPVARLVWEAAHGPIPPLSMVVFKDQTQRTNVLELITLDKLECITREENARRNHPRNKSAELAKLYQLKGAITRQVNRISREAREGQST